MGLSTRSLGPALGVEIRGVDLTAPLGNLTEPLLELLWEHGLLLFRHQELSPEQQIALTRQFGEPEEFDDAPGQIEGFPSLFRVANQPGRGRLNIGMYWHHDGSFREIPPSLSFLHMVEVPASGAETWFSNSYRAYDLLNDDAKALLSPLKAVDEDGVQHALIRTHPVTGQKSLYVNLGRTVDFTGLNSGEKDDLLHFLEDHVGGENLVYHHRWSPREVLFYDNAGVAHRAQPSSEPRIVHRTTVTGTDRF